jgi:hypothetical protein
MVSEVYEYVAEERSYSVTVFGFSFDIFTDSEAIWRHFVIPRRGVMWRHFDIAGGRSNVAAF